MTNSLRPFYEKALERVKRDINEFLLLEEPQHKALVEAFKAAESFTEALTKLKESEPDPLARLPKEALDKIDQILKDYL